MSAEAERRLQDDLRFLESVNVWHLVNLRSPTPHAMYTTSYPERLDIISPALTHLGTLPQNSYDQLPQRYIEEHKYLTTNPTLVSLVGNNASFHSNNVIATPPISHGIGTSLPYPDLIIHAHAQDIAPRKISQRTLTDLDEEVNEELESLSTNSVVGSRDFSPVIQNSLPLKETPRLKHLSLLPKEPTDYDAEEKSQDCATPDGKKAVSFTSDTIFIERDMNSPFWMAFAERRRLRRLHRQKRQLNAQISSVTYQPSLFEIVKAAFSKSSRDTNGNCTKRKHHHSKKGEVLVYENSSQIPESFTAQYIYSVPPTRSNKLMQIITCQCCSSDNT